MASKGFAAMGKSLLSMGESVISGTPPPSSKSKKRNHRKKNKKSTESVETIETILANNPNLRLADDYDDWQSPSKSKKAKGKGNDDVEHESPAPSNHNSSPPVKQQPTASRQPVKKFNNGSAQPVAKPEAKDKPMEPLKEKLEVPFRQKHEKQTKPTDTAKSKPSTEIAAPPPIPPSKPTAPPAKPQSRQTKGQKNLEVLQNNEMADLYAYFLNLEAALASNVGSAAVQELRSAHPKLHFTQPVPDSASNAPINDNPTKKEMLEMKTALMVKEGEVDFYKSLLKNNSIDLTHLPLIEIRKFELPTVKETPKKLKVASIQCLLTKEPQASAPAPSAPSGTRTKEEKQAGQKPQNPPPSRTVTLDQSLHDQICVLTNENSTLQQRIEIVRRENEAIKADCEKMKAEAKKVRNKTAKETRDSVKKEFETLIDNLKAEIAEKETQITAKSSQLLSLEAKMEPLKLTVNQLKQNEKHSANRLVELELSLKKANVESEALSAEKFELTQSIEKFSSELSWWKHIVTEKDNELAQVKEECSVLKAQLETVLLENAAREENAADSEQIECLKGEISTLRASLSDKEEKLSAARGEAHSKQEKLDQLQKDLAEKTAEVASAKKAYEEAVAAHKKELEKKAMEEVKTVPKENGGTPSPSSSTSKNCDKCFMLEEVNAELRSALERTRNDLLALENDL